MRPQLRPPRQMPPAMRRTLPRSPFQSKPTSATTQQLPPDPAGATWQQQYLAASWQLPSYPVADNRCQPEGHAVGMDYRLLPQVVDSCRHSPQFVGTIHRASKLLELCDKPLKTAITLEAELACAPQQDFHHVLHFARQRQLFRALTAAAKLPGGFHAGLPMPNPGARQSAGIRGALPACLILLMSAATAIPTGAPQLSTSAGTQPTIDTWSTLGAVP